MWEAFKVFLKCSCRRSYACPGSQRLPFFFCFKDSTWAPYEQTKTVSRTFLFSWRYSRKMCVHVVNHSLTWCQHSQRLCWHSVSVVIDYTPTQCHRSQWLRRHRVSTVVDSILFTIQTYSIWVPDKQTKYFRSYGNTKSSYSYAKRSYGFAKLKTPVPVRTLKISNLGHGEHLDGWPYKMLWML